jgi:hypothetical protein
MYVCQFICSCIIPSHTQEIPGNWVGRGGLGDTEEGERLTGEEGGGNGSEEG